MNRKVWLIALSLLMFVGCGRQDKEAIRPHEDSTQRPPQSHPQSCPSIVPPVEDVIFVDAETVLVFPGHFVGIADEEAVNRDRAPVITRDGGESWNTLAAQPLEFESICFANVSLGWLVKQGSELWTTTDGGFNWSFVSKIEDHREPLNYSQQAKFRDELNGWVLGLDSLWRTDDSGRTWSRHEFPSLVAGFFLRGDAVWVASQYRSEQNNAVYETRDGGASWDEREIPNTAPGLFDSVDIRDLFFVDDQTGWLADTLGVYRTDDGGNSWTRQRLPQRKIGIESLCFVNELEGWAAGYKVLNAAENEFDAILLHTTNGGGAWSSVDVGDKQTSFDRVYFGDAQNGWLVANEAGQGEDDIFQNANIYRTRNGGVTWQKVLSVKSPYLTG